MSNIFLVVEMNAETWQAPPLQAAPTPPCTFTARTHTGQAYTLSLHFSVFCVQATKLIYSFLYSACWISLYSSTLFVIKPQSSKDISPYVPFGKDTVDCDYTARKLGQWLFMYYELHCFIKEKNKEKGESKQWQATHFWKSLCSDCRCASSK